jgi:hypothetical protein
MLVVGNLAHNELVDHRRIYSGGRRPVGPADAGSLMTAIGASRPLRRIPAIVSFLNPQPTLSLVGGNRSLCPLTDLAATTKRWRGWWGADIGVYRPAESSNRADSSPVPTFGLCPLPLFRRTLSLTGGFLSDCVKRLHNVGSAALTRFVTPTELQDGRIGA